MNNFETRLKELQAQRVAENELQRQSTKAAENNGLRRLAVTRLVDVIERLGEELNLDEEKLSRSIKTSRRSAYGRVPELITKIASIYAWPLADASQISEIESLQDTVLDTLIEMDIKVSGELLMDIKESKGFNSFLDQATFQIVEGVEPAYDELEDNIKEFATAAGIAVVDYKMNETVFVKQENKALDRIQLEHEAAEEALARHNEMIGA